jgi:hypothetical protein
MLMQLIDPLLMNAFNAVNIAGACIVTTVEFAGQLQIPEDKWIYLLGGAGTRDSYSCKFDDIYKIHSHIFSLGETQSIL